MKRGRITGTLVTLLFLAACSSGGGASDASPASLSDASSVDTSPSVVVQTAIPDGIYRTRPRTEQDLVALGLTKKQIDFAKNVNELWKKTIVYELRIKGDNYVLTAASDGGTPGVEDQGTLIVQGSRVEMVFDSQPQYTMRFWVSDSQLRLKLLANPCRETDPEHCSDFLVRGAYEALPFNRVS